MVNVYTVSISHDMCRHSKPILRIRETNDLSRGLGHAVSDRAVVIHQTVSYSPDGMLGSGACGIGGR